MNEQITTKLIEQEETAATTPIILEEIKKFATHVPVAKYTAPSKENGHESGLEFQQEDGIDCFFKLDYSTQLTQNGRSGYELLRLIKEFSTRVYEKTSKDFWKIFRLKLPYMELSEDEQKRKEQEKYNATYKDSVITCFTFPEDIAKIVTRLLLTGKFQGSFLYPYLQHYLYKPFRYQTSQEKEIYYVPQDAYSQHFYQSLRIFRNKGQHLEGDEVSGDKNKLFEAPAGSVDEKVQLEYYRDRHLSIGLYMLLIFDRFYDELWKILDMKVEPKDSSEERIVSLLEKSKDVIKNIYIKKVHEKSEQAMQQFFLGTGIHNHPKLLYDIPELYIKGEDSEHETLTGAGSDLLSDTMSPLRQLVVGDVGTGKTVMFLRMLQRDQPRLTPFYLSLDKTEIGGSTSFLRYLEHQVLGLEYLTLKADELTAVILRLHQQLKEGKVVFFFDSLDANPSQMDNLLQWINRYPKCRYIVGSQPDSEENRFLKPLKENGFRTFEVLPFKNEQVKQIMRFTSMYVSGIDHTKQLTEQISKATQDTDMIRHPFSLMQLVGLFEESQDKEILANNQSRLYQSLRERILTNRHLDLEECERLLAQPFLVRYKEQIQQVSSLFEEVMKRFKDPTQGDWRAAIMKSPLIMTGTVSSLRSLFELMELIPTNNQHQQRELTTFQCLVTSELLKKGLLRATESGMNISIDHEGHINICGDKLAEITPMLSLLAEATVTLSYKRPNENDYKKQENLYGRVIFGLCPRYMIEQYLLTVLHVYRLAGVMVNRHKVELKELFSGIARSGSRELYRELFNPYWMNQWLIHEKDVLPGFDTSGMVADDNKALLTILQEHCTRHDLLLPLLMEQYIWIRMWKLENTMRLWGGLMRSAIIYHMNDRLRESLYYSLNTMDNNQSHEIIGYFKNLAISTMESLSLIDQYDTNIDDIPGLAVQQKLMNMQSRKDALRLLIKWLYPLYRGDDRKYHKQMYLICEHLINYNAPSIQQVSEEFWTFLSMLSEDNSYRQQLANLLDKIPIEDIPSQIALRLYDEHIYEYVLKEREIERKKEISLKSFPSIYQRYQQMFRPVTKVNGNFRFSIQYTFYCQPDKWTFEVATECISEMPEGKFCQIKTNKFDQWFYVEDVIVQETERPLNNGIAEVSLVLPQGAPRLRTGKLKIMGVSEDAAIPYIHLFEREGHHEVVVRIEEQHWVGVLAMSETQMMLKKERRVTWNGYEALLTGVDVRTLPKEMRIIRLRAVMPFLGEGSPKAVERMELDDIPHQGSLSFYNTKDLSMKYNRLNLSQIWRGNIAEVTMLANVLYIDCKDDKHYLATYKQVNVGNILHWGEVFMNVNAVFLTAKECSVEQKAPQSIYAAFNQYMGWQFKAYNEERKKKNKGVKPPLVYPYIIEVRKVMSLSKIALAKQTIIDNKVDVLFYHPITDPVPASWQQHSNDIVFSKVYAKRVKIADQMLLSIQDGVYPKEIAYYYDPHDRSRRPVKWYVEPCSQENSEPQSKRFMLLDEELTATWQKSAVISFYSSERNKNEQPIGIHFSNLTDLVELNRFTKYHASVVPLLLKEWIKQRSISNEQALFCQAKRLLPLLIRTCIMHGISLEGILNIELAYVLDVGDDGEVTLFTPSLLNKHMDKNTWRSTIKLYISKFNGVRPPKLKANMLVLKTATELITLEERLIRMMSSQTYWGFLCGTVSETKDNKGARVITIQRDNSDIVFNVDAVETGCKLVNNTKVRFFPKVNNEKRKVLEAAYIIVYN